MTKEAAKDLAEAFIDYLGGLKTTKCWTPARAALRRSLAFDPGAYPPVFPYVEPFIGGEDGWRREVLYLVAGLYALKDGEHQPGRTLALALRELWEKRQSVEGRFLALLDADRDELPFRLRQAAGMVEGGIDFSALTRDLLDWFHPDRYRQAKWAREFYRKREEGGAQ
ncbi:MAG: type I-E CRISPR-associated protein Cse2/CasB [Thermus sp.]